MRTLDPTQSDGRLRVLFPINLSQIIRFKVYGYNDSATGRRAEESGFDFRQELRDTSLLHSVQGAPPSLITNKHYKLSLLS
jgi:hypothetical protein